MQTVGCNQAQRIAAEARHVHRLRDAAMRRA